MVKHQRVAICALYHGSDGIGASWVADSRRMRRKQAP